MDANAYEAGIVEAYESELRKKDSEIERLKADFQKAKGWNQLCELQITNLQSIVENQRKLITELADALESMPFVLRPLHRELPLPQLHRPHRELIYHAREATK